MQAALAGCGHSTAEPTIETTARADTKFQPLNPARGDASPQAGVLWGNIKQDVPSGALIVFADGFSSPPHIHNITYRAIVITGAVHNDDPNAEKTWMGPGSFWTQPAGESHTTAAAKGGKGTAFLEILEGPYLVRPEEEAFDNGERSVNIDARNLVWLDSSDIAWFNHSGASMAIGKTKIAFLWGQPQRNQQNGTMLKIPSGKSGELHGNDSWMRAVVIQGQINHQLSGKKGEKKFESGSYFGSNENTIHKVTCKAKKECLIYVSAKGKYRFIEM
ncbi:MAG: DUF4437 domain-containing protein [Pseudomonadales bacterium]|nr:DUF4437 domain-containing protein [Pseudomonadales bacterium]